MYEWVPMLDAREPTKIYLGVSYLLQPDYTKFQLTSKNTQVTIETAGRLINVSDKELSKKYTEQVELSFDVDFPYRWQSTLWHKDKKVKHLICKPSAINGDQDVVVLTGEETTLMHLAYAVMKLAELKVAKVFIPNIGDYRRVFVFAWLGKYLPRLLASSTTVSTEFFLTSVFGGVNRHDLTKLLATNPQGVSYIPCCCPVCSKVQDIRAFTGHTFASEMVHFHNAFLLQNQARYWNDIAKTSEGLSTYLDALELSLKKDSYDISRLDLKKLKDVMKFADMAATQGVEIARKAFASYFVQGKKFSIHSYAVVQRERLNSDLFEFTL